MKAPRPGLWWTVAATATVLGAAFWLRAPAPGTLLACAATTLLSVVLTIRGDRALNRIGFAVAASAFVLLVGWAQRTSAALAANPNAARAALAARGTAAMAATLEAETAALQRLAVEALDAHADVPRAFADLDKLRGSAPSRAVVLIRGGTPFAWSGRLMTPLDSLTGPVGVWPTPFYLAIYAIAGRGSDRAVAEALVHADPPGEVLASALDARLAAKYGVERFDYHSLADTTGDSLAVVHAAGVPVLAVRAVAPPGEQLASVALARGRSRGGIALAIATLFFLAATWRERGGVSRRLAALAVALAAVALVPLSGFSNATSLFDPTYFYVATGGPFTGSVGALALTCSLVLLGMLAALRARIGMQSRLQAIAAVVVVAGVGPFLLRDLARGIQFPEAGVSMRMWLAWESTLFLASVSVLMAGATAGQAALGARRGIPLWIAPAIAAVAAVLAPPLMDAPGAFPPWYPALWVVAIGALAFARRARGSVLPVAVVAACGAVTLVWGQSVHSRVLLAERDVGSLNMLDSSEATLLQRFTAQLDVSHAPATRTELLARYAASDLASGDYPVELTSWSPSGVPIADLLVGKAEKTESIGYFAMQAQDSTHAVFTKVLGWPGLYLVLSVPHEDRSVTTVVVAPRTRLLARDAFGALMGFGTPTTTDPPYTLTLGGVRHNALFTNEAQWERHGDELHGDRFLPDRKGGFTVVHASVQLRNFNQLIMRGSLVVVLDLFALFVLWLLLVIADGAFGRWLRIQRRRWLRSYRAQLTLALFAFFVIPAGVFAAWSYQRLRSDDDQARNLLVRETLRGVAVYTDSASVKLADVAAKFQTPLFLYADGVLKASSDSVLDALAPLGRLLPASSAITLSEGDEITSSSDETVGSQPMLFGFRVASTDASPVQFVLAAPARTDDLALDQRRRDLGILVLFAAVIGAIAALWLSELAARQFSRPIRALQAGALALASGEREPQLTSNPPVEFQPVFTAFRQMAHDIEAGRDQEAHAQRVLAWGEMARQVAHEIKNPLTPMRLGMQHLRRARHDPDVDFDRVLDENVSRVLSEIDRLDEIARSFSRYGTAPADRASAVPVDLAEAVGDVMRLEQLGGGDVRWSASGADLPLLVLASRAEIREVLLNLLENARLASARHVEVTLSRSGDRVRVAVRDDGQGIAGDVMPRIFEPHFSTRTSGSGLGLAISRRMIEGWGGTIHIDSAPGEGTTVHIALVPAPAI